MNELLTQGEQLMEFRQRLHDMSASPKVANILDMWWVLALREFNTADVNHTGIYESDLIPARWELPEPVMVGEHAIPQYEVGIYFETRVTFKSGEQLKHWCCLSVNDDVKVSGIVPANQVKSWKPLDTPEKGNMA